VLVLKNDALVGGFLGGQIVAQQAMPCGPGAGAGGDLGSGFVGDKVVDQIWQCGCGLLAPIIAPRFSKTCST